MERASAGRAEIGPFAVRLLAGAENPAPCDAGSARRCTGWVECFGANVDMIAHHRVDLSPLITHRFALEDIATAYDLFAAQREGVMKVALTPLSVKARREIPAHGAAVDA